MAADTVPDLDLSELQGNILRSYGRRYGHVRHLVLAVADPGRARAALAAMVDGDRSTPEVTRADVAPKDADMAWCLNVGITYRGLEALGVPRPSLATFPREFRQGMVARAARLGDVGGSDPQKWIPGLADDSHVHLLVTIYGRAAEDLGSISDRVVGAGDGQAFRLVTPEPLDGAFLVDAHGDNIVHFGFNDGISQPRFEHVHPSTAPLAPLGLVLLGHPVPSLGLSWTVPQPEVLGLNGTFGAFRVLRQDVAGFEAFLHATAAATGCSAEEVAAKMCGRWRLNGAPLTLAPTEADAAAFGRDRDLNDFGYRRLDADGARCPLGSHIRRTNPRDGDIVQRGTSANRAVVRRGVPYGPPYDPHHPGDGVRRGLLGNFLCASLAGQFEAMQADWVNVGLQDPRLTGTNDPLVGANDGMTTELRWTTSAGHDVVSRRLPSFVDTEGGAYCFVPSIPSIRWIASEGWRSAF